MSEVLPNPLNPDYDWFLKKVLNLTHLDLTYYKRAQMERRILHLMSRNQVDNYPAYIKLLESSDQKLQDFISWVTINVSEFYRDYDRWELFEKNVMPDLLRRFGRLRIWSAGCSNGSEPYSVAILLNELGSSGHQITASDIDDNTLKQASEARYKASDIKNLPGELRDKYFKFVDNGSESYFQLDQKIMKQVSFKKHNLFIDPFEKGLHLVICRNVVIYFTNEAKEELYSKFTSSLVDSGIFFVGSTESLLNCKKYGLTRAHTAFYQKI